MIEKCIVVLSAFVFIGCASFSLGEGLLSGSINGVLDECKTVPIEEVEECFKTALANRPDGSGITLEDLMEAVEAARAEEAVE